MSSNNNNNPGPRDQQAGAPVSDTLHDMGRGIIIDPTADKDPKHWLVERDPPPDVDIVSFTNRHIGYCSYDPPKGFTAEELVQFQGAEECLSLEKAQKLLDRRDELGTLNLRGDARWM